MPALQLPAVLEKCEDAEDSSNETAHRCWTSHRRAV